MCQYHCAVVCIADLSMEIDMRCTEKRAYACMYVRVYVCVRICDIDVLVRQVCKSARTYTGA